MTAVEPSDSPSIVRILVVAATPALRAGLRALLADGDLRVVGETAAPGGPAPIPHADVVVAADDALLADAARLAAGEPAMALLALTDDPEAAQRLRGLELAAWGVLPRDASPAELQTAARAVAQGLVVLPPPVAARLLAPRSSVGTVAGASAEPLTPREREVLELVSEGLSNKLIARRLQISDHTVKFHISSIFAKLGASSRTEAVHLGARQGLITL